MNTTPQTPLKVKKTKAEGDLGYLWTDGYVAGIDSAHSGSWIKFPICEISRGYVYAIIPGPGLLRVKKWAIEENGYGYGMVKRMFYRRYQPTLGRWYSGAGKEEKEKKLSDRFENAAADGEA